MLSSVVSRSLPMVGGSFRSSSRASLLTMSSSAWTIDDMKKATSQQRNMTTTSVSGAADHIASSVQSLKGVHFMSIDQLR